MEKPPSGHGPALTRSTWLATFPLSLARQETQKAGLAAGAGPEASGWSFRREGRDLGYPRTAGRRPQGLASTQRASDRPRRHPRLWNSAVATYLDASRNLATGAPRLRSAVPLGPARSPPPARYAPAPPPAVSVATAPDAGAARAWARGGADAAAASLEPDQGARPRRTRPARARRTGPRPRPPLVVPCASFSSAFRCVAPDKASLP